MLLSCRWYRAPELLCHNNTYDNKIDVWGVGVIFGELFKRSVVLRVRLHVLHLAPTLPYMMMPMSRLTATMCTHQGNSYINQLRLTVELLGQVSAEDLSTIE